MKEDWEAYKEELFLEAPFSHQSRGGRKRKLQEEGEEERRSASRSSRTSFTPNHSRANTPASDFPPLNHTIMAKAGLPDLYSPQDSRGSLPHELKARLGIH
jgi:hypothetical protein